VDALQKARELDHKRRNFYASIAEYQIPTHQLEPEGAVEGIIDFLENYA